MSFVRRGPRRGTVQCVTADELLPGRATAEGTRRYADRFADLPGHFRSPDQLWLSSLGLGTKSGGPRGADDLLYRGSIPRALAGGINVFDTALSYRMQASERTLGSALRRALAGEVARRDEVFVITKGGYLTLDPDSPLARQGHRYLIETYVETGLIDPARVVNGVHSLDPRFIADQIERSRRNLGLETIDLYCIQQPELQLVERGPDEFKGILRALFATLEEAVARGDIAAYGLSTWTGLLLPHLERGHLAVAELLELALDVGGPDHHMRALQLPYSVAMGEARGLDSQFGPEGRTTGVLETLRDTGTAVFAAEPLFEGRAVRGLPAFLRESMADLRTDAQRSLQFARSTPGVTTALVGMRREEHVDENLELCRHAPASPEVIERLFEIARARSNPAA